jgi:hypothetical protein
MSILFGSNCVAARVPDAAYDEMGFIYSAPVQTRPSVMLAKRLIFNVASTTRRPARLSNT